MKTLITLLLVLSLSTATVERVQAQPSMCALMAYVGGAAVLMTLFLYVSCKNSNPGQVACPCRLVLMYNSDLSGNWTPIATNDILAGPAFTNKWAAFAVVMDPDLPRAKCYYVKVLPFPTNGFQVVQANWKSWRELKTIYVR